MGKMVVVLKAVVRSAHGFGSGKKEKMYVVLLTFLGFLHSDLTSLFNIYILVYAE